MNEVFPLVDIPPELMLSSREELPMFREYAWDFKNDEFVLKDGQLVLLEGQEALRVWIYKALRTERYRYMAYSWDYGNEMEQLIGSTLSQAVQHSEAERYIRETLLALPYIREIRDVEVSSERDQFKIEFTVETVYGEVKTRV
ncbi:hypothetical protein BVG16_05635 [Paenibacillus selenitireducens]|uniref:DUF2634 domain-containing protein n=1 Tax=Paenibacillus selenitireducens TaxID=1324314 RepID=A0A1T2XK71_9BACL|nr:DUF2634 domain-containing protein [Paenibacillus selenitireducens]OPA80225.1 hypothetical protein BVG16_05635 [Paenibacillus selenitireducens]